jgi:hypothetical protein
MSHQFTIETLLAFGAVRSDCEHRCTLCAGHARSGSSSGLSILGRECAQGMKELKVALRAPGAELCAVAPRDRAPRRARGPWTALACSEDGAILDECERGTSRPLEVYRSALDEHLPDAVRGLCSGSSRASWRATI